MSGGWQGSDRLSELPANWPTIRDRILKRDGHRCRWIENNKRCTGQATDVDHIRPGNDHSDSNLRSLCKTHHRLKSSAEGVAARRRHSRRREPEPHPGMRGTPRA